MSETQVSDVYVRLGNDFNAAVAAFRSFNIDMRHVCSRGFGLQFLISFLLVNYNQCPKIFVPFWSNVYPRKPRPQTSNYIYPQCAQL